MRGLMPFILAAIAGLAIAQAAQPGGWMNDEELRELVTDRTISGSHDNGMPYSEWHAPSGQVYGHNNFQQNEKACWDIKDNAVCYYYADGPIRGTFCWKFRKISDGRLRLQSVESTTTAYGEVKDGNPLNYSDNGTPWTCQKLLSERETKTRRLASR
jgi:hypothetical protein